MLYHTLWESRASRDCGTSAVQVDGEVLRDDWRGEQQNGDIYLLYEKDVRRFILEHPTDIDLRKVDQIWFLDYVEYKLDATVSF